ncbi:MAG: hypothetical protein ACPGTQ_12925 [Colwellia sp.]
MFFNFSKAIIVLFVCLSFVGQATASAVMSYHMMHMSGSHAQMQPDVTSSTEHAIHAGHNMMMDVQEKKSSSSDNCCTKNCSCFASGCSSALSFIVDTTAHPYFNLSSKISSNNGLIQSQLSSSLFKPPISV